MKGYAVSENGYADHTVAEREAFIHRKRFEALIYKPVLVLSLAMTLFEVPLWCKNGSWWEWESAKVQCPSPDGSHVYFSNLPYMPKGVATIGELLICATLLYLTKDSITSGSKLSHRFSRESYATIAKFRLVVAIAMVVDFLVFLILNNVCNVQVRSGGARRRPSKSEPPAFRKQAPNAPPTPTPTPSPLPSSPPRSPSG